MVCRLGHLVDNVTVNIHIVDEDFSTSPVLQRESCFHGVPNQLWVEENTQNVVIGQLHNKLMSHDHICRCSIHKTGTYCSILRFEHILNILRFAFLGTCLTALWYDLYYMFKHVSSCKSWAEHVTSH